MEHNHLYNFGGEYNEEQIREIILNLSQWFTRRLKDFLSEAQAALLFGGVVTFMQF